MTSIHYHLEEIPVSAAMKALHLSAIGPRLNAQSRGAERGYCPLGAIPVIRHVVVLSASVHVSLR